MSNDEEIEQQEVPEAITELPQETFEQILNIFVLPEVERRQKENRIEKPLVLRAAQVIFYPDGRKPEIRLNEEVKAEAEVRFKPGISKKPGDDIYEDDIEGIERIKLPDNEDPDCGHITLVRIGDGWRMAWDARYNKGLSRSHIAAAQQFYEAAEFSLTQKNWLSFIDNLFSAAELASKAILLAVPDEEFRRKTNHKAIHSRFNRYANLGNVDSSHRDTFNRLAKLRYEARYLQQETIISEAEAHQFIAIIKELIELAKRWAAVE